MARFLPPQPSIEHLRNEAKALLKAHRRGDPGACATLRHIRRFSDASDKEILAAEMVLAEVQFALAVEYGFSGWREMRESILSMAPREGSSAIAGDDAFLIPDPPAGHGKGNRFAALYSMAITYLGAPADYVSVLGDSGLAFILQADAIHTPYGRKDIRNLDIGWWPLDPWGALLRLDFLRDIYGCNLRELPVDLREFSADPPRYFRANHQPAVEAGLRAGYPAIAFGPDGYLVVGFDKGEPPLLGQLCCVEGRDVKRLEQYPWLVMVPEEAEEKLDRAQADVEALRFAVRLGHDKVNLAHLPGKSSGAESWDLWARQAQDSELCGPHYYHANVVGHLHVNRSGASAYLRQMAGRHPGPAGEALLRASEIYGLLVQQLGTADVSEAGVSSEAGRSALAALIRRIAAIEVQALDEMEIAEGKM